MGNVCGDERGGGVSAEDREVVSWRALRPHVDLPALATDQCPHYWCFLTVCHQLNPNNLANCKIVKLSTSAPTSSPRTAQRKEIFAIWICSPQSLTIYDNSSSWVSSSTKTSPFSFENIHKEAAWQCPWFQLLCSPLSIILLLQVTEALDNIRYGKIIHLPISQCCHWNGGENIISHSWLLWRFNKIIHVKCGTFGPSGC